MTKTIALCQSKGGTSKTSSVLNISACLVRNGYRVLAVDVDQQASLTVSLGIDPATLPLSMRAILTDPEVTANDVLVQTQEGIDLIPANLDLSLVEFHMSPVGRDRILARKLHQIAPNYDFIVIDTPPSFAITTLNAMAAADYLLVPMQPEPLCLLGMSQLTEAYKLVQQDANPKLEILGIFIALYDGRSSYHRDIAAKVRQDWGELTFKTIIRRRMGILEAALEGRATVSLSPNSEIAQDYLALTGEILSRVQQ
jgi:chromosome partitioning protein